MGSTFQEHISPKIPHSHGCFFAFRRPFDGIQFGAPRSQFMLFLLLDSLVEPLLVELKSLFPERLVTVIEGRLRVIQAGEFCFSAISIHTPSLYPIRYKKWGMSDEK